EPVTIDPIGQIVRVISEKFLEAVPVRFSSVGKETKDQLRGPLQQVLVLCNAFGVTCEDNAVAVLSRLEALAVNHSGKRKPLGSNQRKHNEEPRRFLLKIRTQSVIELG